MSELDTIEALAKAIGEHIHVVPLSVDLWDGEMIAQYMKMSKRYVLEVVTCRPDFPKPIPLPGRGMRRWKAKEVIEWAEGLRKNSAKAS